ncbi:carbohydrate ABC transporter permease [Paenibacillus sp.]|uniref:carbohydrate ABC transporter permease n=1 Tax=Paenibacillus sp. TaxID=58172 RepID=UPI002D28BDB0|nr:carbohydrate ABC transporter permease [Paenibacillus sp.]HZG85963.1 carbohydrate ABC transporter permease [Paenibacillus sp.]
MVKDRSFSSKALDVVTHSVMVAVVLVTLLPFVHIVAISFSGPKDVVAGNVFLWPVNFDLVAYKLIFSNFLIPKSFVNSVIITVLGTAINMAVTVITAYPLAKSTLPFRSFFLKMFLLTMFFSGGLVPKFLLVNSLGMYDSFWALTVPLAINTYFLIIMLSFFKNFPREIEESAKMDGCNELQVLLRIVLPLSMASVMTIGLFYAVQHWNSYFQALLYINSNDKYPLQLILRQIVLQSQVQNLMQGTPVDYQTQVNSESLKYGTLVISIVPMLVLYPFVQKYFVRGVMIGSLKG